MREESFRLNSWLVARKLINNKGRTRRWTLVFDPKSHTREEAYLAFAEHLGVGFEPFTPRKTGKPPE